MGSFNPVTNAHIAMGVVARDILGPECEIIYVPASDKYISGWKGYWEGDILREDVRLRLLLNAVSEYDFEVSIAELDGTSDGKTYNTLSHFGFEDTILCIGMDNVPKMRKWYRYKSLLSSGIKLLVFERQGCKVTDKALGILSCCREYRIAELPADTIGISSTKIRNYYKNGDMDKLQHLVPRTTYQYLKENKHVYF